MSQATNCDRCPLLHHLILQGTVWLHHICNCPSKTCKLLSRLCLLFARLNYCSFFSFSSLVIYSRPHAICTALCWPGSVLSTPFLKWGIKKTDSVFQRSLTSPEQRAIIIMTPHLLVMLFLMYSSTGFAIFAVTVNCCLVFTVASTKTQGYHHQLFLQTWTTRLILAKLCFKSLYVSLGVSTGAGLLKTKLEQCRQPWEEEY